MELKRYAAILWRWAWLILLGTVLAGGAAYGVSKLTTPIYRATTTLLVNQASNYSLVTDYTSVLTSQQLAKTYSELVKKRPVSDAVIANLKPGLTSDQLAAKIQVNLVRDTMLMSISVEDENPQLAMALVNEVANVFIQQTNDTQRARFASSEENLSKELKQLQADMSTAQKALDQARGAATPNQSEVAGLQTVLSQYQNNYASLLKSYEDLRVTEARSTDSLSVAELADLPRSPVRPQTLMNTLLAAVVGAMLAVGVAFLVEYLDDTLKSPEDIKETLDLITMGIVARFPHDQKDPKSSIVVASNPRSPISEAFRTLRTNIQFASVDRKIRTILVTSANPGEGKSTVTANLAMVLAQAGQRVALMDGDLRRPTVHRWLGLSNNAGLTNAVISDAGHLNGFLQATDTEFLKVLTSGPLPPNPAELLGSERMRQILEDLKSTVDVVVIDAPPTLVVTDPAVLSKWVDAVLLVVESGATRREAARLAAENLQRVGANVIGVVLNKLTSRRSGYYNHYGQYYYYYATSGERKKKPKSSPAHGPRAGSNGHGPKVDQPEKVPETAARL